MHKYSEEYKQDILIRITKFFEYHFGLDSSSTRNTIDANMAEQNLKDWTSGDNELFVILFEGKSVGFLRIGYRGGNVAWIEDVFVDEDYRNKGIATNSILQAEEIIKSHLPYNAVCFDVVPNNMEALKLYHKLGYDTLSLVTVRKELKHCNRGRNETILGLKFKL